MSYVTVSVDDAHLGGITSVAQALQEQGMHVEQVLGAVGVITGSVAQERRRLLESVPGVASVLDEQLSYQLPSPGADVQ
jgi:hypothetical protein